MDEQYPGPEDIRLSARLCQDAFLPPADRDWSMPAGDLEWSARTTLAHIVDGQLFYAVHLANRAPTYLPGPHTVDPQTPILDLLTYVESASAVLAEVVRAAPAEARGFHFYGMADPSGFAAMGCDEILIHTDDLARGFGIPFLPPGPLCRRIVDRLFPWAPRDVAPWAALRWANDRIALPGHERLGPNWRWHCAPLSEWDGSMPTE